jgi:hypothetical protein
MEGCCVVSAADLCGRDLGFLDRGRYFFFQAAPQLYSEILFIYSLFLFSFLGSESCFVYYQGY